MLGDVRVGGAGRVPSRKKSSAAALGLLFRRHGHDFTRTPRKCHSTRNPRPRGAGLLAAARPALRRMFSSRARKLTFALKIFIRDLIDIPFVTGVIYLKWNLDKVDTTAKKEGFSRRGAPLVTLWYADMNDSAHPAPCCRVE